MRVAKHLGLSVANAETTEIAGRKVIIVERYDRDINPRGVVERIHQEDFCQALGIPPETKYQADGGPSFVRIAGIVATVAAPDSLERFLEAVVLNVLVGNGDAHAKNFSLLRERSGALRLSPLYDVLCTLHYGDDRLAMYLDDVRRTNRVTPDRIANEATRWGMGKRFATTVINDLLARAEEAIASARAETEGVPPALVTTVMEQLGRWLRAADGPQAFLPKATMSGSPFHFLVIDDPVQAMDPSKVDGLARVLAKVATDRQVIVFIHDDLLPDSIRRPDLPARIIGVSRRPWLPRRAHSVPCGHRAGRDRRGPPAKVEPRGPSRRRRAGHRRGRQDHAPPRSGTGR